MVFMAMRTVTLSRMYERPQPILIMYEFSHNTTKVIKNTKLEFLIELIVIRANPMFLKLNILNIWF